MMFPDSVAHLVPPLAFSFSPLSSLWGNIAPPTIQLGRATFYSSTDGSMTSFLNILFAEPAIGDLRLQKPIEHYNYTIDVTTVVEYAEHASAKDKLEYLREVPAGEITAAATSSPVCLEMSFQVISHWFPAAQTLALSWALGDYTD